LPEPSWLSLLPPVLAIALAIGTRQVYLSLAAGIWLGTTLLHHGDPLAGLAAAIEETIAVLGSAGSAKVIVFTLVIGALIATLARSGGVAGFVAYLESRRWVSTPRRARMLAWVIGVIIFIESNITVLVAGSVCRPLFDRFKIAREKLAYLIDSTSAAVCILIPLNAWGAYNLALLEDLEVEGALTVFLQTIPLNAYALAAIAVAAVVAWRNTRADLGPMRAAEERASQGGLFAEGAQPMVDEEVLSPEPWPAARPRARAMVIPIVVMVLMMPLGLYITGEGDLRAGSGSTSVLWAVLAALAAAWVLILGQRAATVETLTRTGLRGAGGLVPLALILLLALALGGVTRELGTGAYVASLIDDTLPAALLLPLAFLISATIAFSTGTSWGTFAIMIPIVVPAAAVLDLPLAPFMAAALSGGIFGDHASPISDTTIISSMASATDHIDHVRTQLPYALLAAALATASFTLIGLAI
jgi:tetracycline resistance efflux pump